MNFNAEIEKDEMPKKLQLKYKYQIVNFRNQYQTKKILTENVCVFIKSTPPTAHDNDCQFTQFSRYNLAYVLIFMNFSPSN